MAHIKELTEDKVIAVAHLGYKSDGKVVQKQKTFKRPKSVSVSRWIKSTHLTVVSDWESDLKSSSTIQNDMKLDAFIDLWEKEHAKTHLRASTLENYKDKIRLYILPDLGHYPLSKITTLKVQKLINKIAQPKEDGSTLSKRTVEYPKQILSSILTQAVKWGYLPSNPCKDVSIPPIPKKYKKKYWELEEVKALMDLVKNEPLKYQAIFYLGLSGGLRRGEILGLSCEDLTHDGVLIKKAKNNTSVRSVSLDATTMTILRRHKAEQRKMKDILNIDSDWLFTQADGSKMFYSTPSQWLRKLCRANEIEWASFHALRHTSATLLISSGVDIKTVSSRIGHQQTSTTLNIYTHMLREKEKAAGDLMGELLHRGEKNGFYMGISHEEEKEEHKHKKQKSL